MREGGGTFSLVDQLYLRQGSREPQLSGLRSERGHLTLCPVPCEKGPPCLSQANWKMLPLLPGVRPHGQSLFLLWFSFLH